MRRILIVKDLSIATNLFMLELIACIPSFLSYCVPTVPSLFDAIFFMNPLNFPPPLPLPPSICEPDIEGPMYGCFCPGIGGTAGASAAAGRGRDAKCCDSISDRPASIVA
jgi:hypothetical protein